VLLYLWVGRVLVCILIILIWIIIRLL
jgi:hypothetical protein